MGSNPSTIWSQLAFPNPASGMMPYVNTDGLTIGGDVLNLYWNSVSKLLSVKTNGDYGGTDAINTYYEVDSYLPNSLVTVTPLGSAQVPGFSVSTSRGTGLVPLSSQSSDFVGKFSGWAYQSGFSTGTYKELAGIFVYVPIGSTANNVGGELHFVTAADAGAVVDRITLDQFGNFFPTTPGVQGTGVQTAASASLGKTNAGFSHLYLDSGDGSAVPGAVTIHKPTGVASIAIGAASVAVTNNLVTAKSIVFAQLQFVDATLTFVKSVIPAAGFFTITGNANATAATKVAFLVINVD